MAGTRKRNPEIMKQISSFVEEYFFEYHGSPSMQKIATAIGTSKSTAYYYVNEMAEKGMLDYDGKNIETRSMQKSDYKMNRAPVLGAIACGSPELTEEDFEEFIALPVALFGEGDFFVLRTHGDSMIDAGIEDGDKVVVKKQNHAKAGDIAGRYELRQALLLAFSELSLRQSRKLRRLFGSVFSFVPSCDAHKTR